MMQCAAHYSESRCAGGEELRIDQRAAAAQASIFPGGKNACISIRRPSQPTVLGSVLEGGQGVRMQVSRGQAMGPRQPQIRGRAQHRPRGGTGTEAKGPPGSP
jgi:hypothetical protein